MDSKKSTKKSVVKIKYFGITAVVLTSFVLLCLITDGFILGIVGSTIASFFKGIFGLSAYPLFLALDILSILIIRGNKIKAGVIHTSNFVAMFIFIVMLVHLITSTNYLNLDYSKYISMCYDFGQTATFGGAFAAIFVYPITKTISIAGAYILIVLLLVLTVFIAGDFLYSRLEKDGKSFISKFVTKGVKEDQKREIFVANVTKATKEQPLQEQRFQQSRPNMFNDNGRNDARDTFNRVNLNRTEPLNPEQNNAVRRLYPDKDELNGNDNNARFTNIDSEALGFKPNKRNENISQSSVQQLFNADRDKKNFNTAYVSPFDNQEITSKPIKVIHTSDNKVDTDFISVDFGSTENSIAKPIASSPERKSSSLNSLRNLKVYKDSTDNLSPILDADAMSEQIRNKKAFSEKVVESPIIKLQPQEEYKIKEEPINILSNTVTPRETIEFNIEREPNVVREANIETKIEKYNSSVTPIEILSDTVEIDEKDYDFEEDKTAESYQIPIFEKAFLKNNEPVGYQIGLSIDDKEKPNIHKYKQYKAPPIELLDYVPIDTSRLTENQQENAKILENTLEQFKIEAKVINIVTGPAVTRFELEMAPGIPVKRVSAFADDIAMNLASKSLVRIEAPIPGKNLFGIEVPNAVTSIVTLRSIIDTDTYDKLASKPLSFVLGIDIGGNPIIPDLADMPHLLVAGATGMGKSVCLNALIVSLMYKYSPEELRFILVDPKRVEFSIYQDMPHMMIKDTIMEPDKALIAFEWLIKEMDRRYILFNEMKVKNIDGYNRSVNLELSEKLPRIVLIVDELSDLISYKKADMEAKILRLAQKARAAGIHLVLATQRPSVDVITGTIKANFPCRIALKASSGPDSKTIFDQGGPEKLIGKGDMLFKNNSLPMPIRLQGAYLSEREIEEVIQYIKDNNETYYDQKIAEEIVKDKNVSNNDTDGNFDPLFARALKQFIKAGQGSTSKIQRMYSIGYPRASKMLEEMEKRGFVSEQDGAKPRQILITLDELTSLFGEIDD